MEHGSKSNGLLTFLEHWGFLLSLVLAVAFCQVFMFFFNLRGAPWIYFFVASIVLLILGAALIVYAKLPVYRSRRFFTFGIESVPPSLTGYYRWGWRVFSFGVALTLCLLLSKQ
jgi:cell division protein FtsW (lipid II flippase)